MGQHLSYHKTPSRKHHPSGTLARRKVGTRKFRPRRVTASANSSAKLFIEQGKATVREHASDDV